MEEDSGGEGINHCGKGVRYDGKGSWEFRWRYISPGGKIPKRRSWSGCFTFGSRRIQLLPQESGPQTCKMQLSPFGVAALLTTYSQIYLKSGIIPNFAVALPDAVKYERIIELVTFCSLNRSVYPSYLLAYLHVQLPSQLPTILVRLPTSLLAPKHTSKHASCDAFEYASFAPWPTP